MEDRNVDGSEPTDAQNEARRLCVEATKTWIDSFEGYEGSLVTGYVLIMETQKIGDPAIVTWMSGNGVDPDENSGEGLATHRAIGLVESTRLTLQARKISEQLRQMKSDEDPSD